MTAWADGRRVPVEVEPEDACEAAAAGMLDDDAAWWGFVRDAARFIRVVPER